MHHSEIWQDINAAVHQAVRDRLFQLDENDLIERSDALLENVPVVGGAQPSTALLLRRYHTQLHQELCVGSQPRATFGSIEDELRELTRAVMVTVDADEGISVESAVLLALILQKRGLTNFCARP
ncbi:MAG TPA: hypothetical protein VFZ66_21590 [Herpetosiphonaceae bacterium]